MGIGRDQLPLSLRTSAPPSKGSRAPPNLHSTKPLALPTQEEPAPAVALGTTCPGFGVTLTRFKAVWTQLLVASIANSLRRQKVGLQGGRDTPVCGGAGLGCRPGV